ncbi:hypothetical protein V6N11_082925 [Hibiscus sabdariffa]|uniref:Uncharacterized protein n=1 Tax=Hibiscus sabdariffa TaxID=183260 RepID=A0ABR2QKU2_9ROSI
MLAADGLVEGNPGVRPPDNGILTTDILAGSGALARSGTIEGVALSDPGHRAGEDIFGMGARQPSPSFRDKLLGTITNNIGSNSLAELDVEEACGITPPTETIAVEASVQRSPDDLYGPWMQLPNHRCRNGYSRKDLGYVNTDTTDRFVESGSFFATLANVSDLVGHEEESTPKNHDRRMYSMSTSNETILAGNVRSPGNGNRFHGVFIGDASGGDVVAQNSKGSSLLKGQLAEKSRKDIEGSRVPQEVPVLDSSFSLTSRAVKGKKKRDVQHSSNPTLAVGLSNLMEDLTNAEELESSKLGASSSDGVGDGDGVSWVQNSTFVHAPATEMQD